MRGCGRGAQLGPSGGGPLVPLHRTWAASSTAAECQEHDYKSQAVQVKVFARNWRSVPSAILHQSKRSRYAHPGSRGWRKKQRRDQCRRARRMGGTAELIFRKYPLPPAQVPATAPFFDHLRLPHLFSQSSLQYSQNDLFLFFLSFFCFLAALQVLRDLSSLTRDGTRPPAVFTTGPPGKSLLFLL